jgi:hypothetical protein
MAGDENKRSEAGTEPETGAGGSEPSAPRSEPSAGHSESPADESPPSETEADKSVPEAAPTSAHGEETTGPGPLEAAATPVEPVSAAAQSPADSDPTRRTRAPLLPRLVPYLVVFAIGALVSIGAAFILSLLAGPPTENRGDIDQRLAALDARATALERKQELDSTTLGALADRFGAAETHARQAVAAVREVEKALAARPPSAESTGGATSAEPVDLGPLAARLQAIEQQLDQDRTMFSSGGSGAETSGAAAEIARAQATAIVAGRLVQEVERGEAYHHELNALLALGVDESKLAPLRTFADTGVASLRRLADEFARLAPAILAAERKGDDDGVVERLKGYASRLVQIERAGDLDSKDLHGLVARIKFALAHDHVGEAYALWKELPEVAKTSSESFGTPAKDRLDTLDAARSIEAGAVAALSKPKS